MEDIVLKMRRPPCPCDGCVPPQRQPGCHNRCGGYIEWKAKCDATYETIKKAREEDYQERMYRVKRARWRKGANYR